MSIQKYVIKRHKNRSKWWRWRKWLTIFFSGARTVNCDQSEDFHTFQLDWTPTELIYSQVLTKCNFPSPNNVKSPENSRFSCTSMACESAWLIQVVKPKVRQCQTTADLILIDLKTAVSFKTLKKVLMVLLTIAIIWTDTFKTINFTWTKVIFQFQTQFDCKNWNTAYPSHSMQDMLCYTVHEI